MDGKEILHQIVQEQLRQLNIAPPEIREKTGGTIYGFCLGAASALTKAGLLAPGAEIAIMAALGAELERQGLGHRVTKTFKPESTDRIGRMSLLGSRGRRFELSKWGRSPEAVGGSHLCGCERARVTLPA